jgi:hypothetical protein
MSVLKKRDRSMWYYAILTIFLCGMYRPLFGTEVENVEMKDQQITKIAFCNLTPESFKKLQSHKQITHVFTPRSSKLINYQKFCLDYLNTVQEEKRPVKKSFLSNLVYLLKKPQMCAASEPCFKQGFLTEKSYIMHLKGEEDEILPAQVLFTRLLCPPEDRSAMQIAYDVDKQSMSFPVGISELKKNSQIYKNTVVFEGLSPEVIRELCMLFVKHIIFNYHSLSFKDKEKVKIVCRAPYFSEMDMTIMQSAFSSQEYLKKQAYDELPLEVYLLLRDIPYFKGIMKHDDLTPVKVTIAVNHDK